MGKCVTPEYFTKIALAPALRLLPANMDTPAARAMCIAIALQESRIEYRRQIGGPARGYFQFEIGGGVRGVLTHRATRQHIHAALTALDYDQTSTSEACWIAIEHNDILASVFARLLLWTLPDALPGRDEADEGWDQYLEAWRPGKPHRDTWNALYEKAWNDTDATP